LKYRSISEHSPTMFFWKHSTSMYTTGLHVQLIGMFWYTFAEGGDSSYLHRRVGLGLELLYRGNRPMAEMLGIWPVLPIQIQLLHDDHRTSNANNVLSALDSKHRARVRGIRLFDLPSQLWEIFSTAMQKQFPKLTHLDISLRDDARAIRDSFLGGSAPRLRSLHLTNTPFPAMKNLLLSASDGST
jgi:hypothetical protein